MSWRPFRVVNERRLLVDSYAVDDGDGPCDR
jgi:hypothetical protein